MPNKSRKVTHRDSLVRSMREDILHLEQKIGKVMKGDDLHIDGKPGLLSEAMQHLGNARVLIAQGMVENTEEDRHGAFA